MGDTLWKGELAVIPGGAPPKNLLKRWLPWFFDERDFVSYQQVCKYGVLLLLRGEEEKKTTSSSCTLHFYIYTSVHDPSPLYVIPVDPTTQTAVMEDPRRPHRYSVTVSPRPDTNLPPPHLVTVLLLEQRTPEEAVVHQFTISTEGDGASASAERLCDCINRQNVLEEKLGEKHKQ